MDDDKLLLALSPGATEHLAHFIGQDCPDFQDADKGCEYCREITNEAWAAQDSAEKAERDESS